MNAAERLLKIVYDATPLLYARSEEEVDVRPAPDKWNAREVMGHLIDSASNNHRRFVEAQFSSGLTFPGYERERWVAAQDYATAEWSTLVALWSSFNTHIAHLVARIPDDVLQRPRPEHNLSEIAWRRVDGGPATLAWLIDDYIEHLDHHLQQIDSSVDQQA